MKLSCKGEKVWHVKVDHPDRDVWVLQMSGQEEATMSARYKRVGPCAKGDPELSLDKDSPECAQMKAQMKMLGPQICASQPAEARAACEAQIAKARAKMEGMCK